MTNEVFRTVRVDGPQEELRARLQNLPLSLLPEGGPGSADLVVGTDVNSSQVGKVLDISGAHSGDAGWTLGFPELGPDQPDVIARSSKVTLPAASVLGAVALLKPLATAGLLSAPGSLPCRVTGTTPASNAGQAVLAHSGLVEMPSFTVTDSAAGRTTVAIPIERSRLAPDATAETVRRALAGSYEAARLIQVAAGDAPDEEARDPEVILLSAIAGPDGGISLAASLDESRTGAIVRVITLMLGLETADESPQIEASNDY